MQTLTSGFSPNSVGALLNAQQVAKDSQSAFYDAASDRTGPGELGKPQVRLLRRGTDTGS
jgi:hypothetical protein